MKYRNYDKSPFVNVRNAGASAWQGWTSIGHPLRAAIKARGSARVVVAVDCYTGVLDDELLEALTTQLSPALVIRTQDAMKSPAKVDAMVEPYVGSDPVFGKLTYLELGDFFEPDDMVRLGRSIAEVDRGVVLVYGVGAALLANPCDLLVYADMARWEAQMRFRRDAICNLGADNRLLKWSLQYKRAFFVDWRVCDKHKKTLIDQWDFVLDTNLPGKPKLATGEAVRVGLRQAANQPIRLVPFFDPAPWGGQWMKEVCDLDRSVSNFGWCFDCVPEENSLLLKIGDVTLELPSIDLVFYQPRALLGEAVYARFGAEFPIRFDFLDTMGGGHLSFQVHPLTQYIQEHFGMHYTQDESYYMLDAGPGACVYLGVKDGVDPRAMAADLRAAKRGDKAFADKQFVNRWPARKHDHFLIPAGTCHCSGSQAMVLEISATPYIFTFKMWDWGRMGLDGKPRPVHLDHGLANIQWDWTTSKVKERLINPITAVSSGPGWREERTGLDRSQFIETRRHWFTGPVPHDTQGTVHVLNLVEGDEAIVESPDGSFEPFVVHYAETFVVPAAVGRYTIRPGANAQCGELATLKAFVRTSA